MTGCVNKVILLGNLGKDPEVKQLKSGDPMVSVRIATNDTWRDRATGERRERTEWHSVVIFNEGLGKIAGQYLRKGSKMYVAGRLRTRIWQDDSGDDRTSTEVVLSGPDCELTLLPDGRRNGGGQARPNGSIHPQTDADCVGCGKRALARRNPAHLPDRHRGIGYMWPDAQRRPRHLENGHGRFGQQGHSGRQSGARSRGAAHAGRPAGGQS